MGTTPRLKANVCEGPPWPGSVRKLQSGRKHESLPPPAPQLCTRVDGPGTQASRFLSDSPASNGLTPSTGGPAAASTRLSSQGMSKSSRNRSLERPWGHPQTPS